MANRPVVIASVTLAMVVTFWTFSIPNWLLALILVAIIPLGVTVGRTRFQLETRFLRATWRALTRN